MGSCSFEFCIFVFLLWQDSIRQFGKCTQRDFFRWIRLPVQISKIEVPLLMDARRSKVPGTSAYESLESISIVLPSDMFSALHDAGSKAPCL